MPKDNAFQDLVSKFKARDNQTRYEIKPAAMNSAWDGFHLGSMYAIWAEAGGGKSTITLQIIRSLCKQGLKGVFIDAEHALNENQQRDFKVKEYVDNGQLIVLGISNFKELEDIVLTLPDSGMNFVVIDSITMVRPYTPNEVRVEDVRPGLTSLQAAQVLNKLKDIAYNCSIGVIMIAHARANIQMTGFVNRYASDKKMAGGFAVQHNPDVITEISVHAQVKDDENQRIGVEIVIQTTKNKWTAPYVQYKEKLIYGRGIDPRISVIESAIEKGLIRKEGRSLIVDGVDQKFNRKTIYDLPAEVLKRLQAQLTEM